MKLGREGGGNPHWLCLATDIGQPLARASAEGILGLDPGAPDGNNSLLWLIHPAGLHSQSDRAPECATILATESMAVASWSGEIKQGQFPFDVVKIMIL